MIINEVSCKEINSVIDNKTQFNSNNYGKFIIKQFENNKSIVIEFVETGFTTKTSISNIKRGLVADKTLPIKRTQENKDYLVGKTFESNSFGSFKIIKYNSSRDVIIQFENTGSIRSIELIHTKTGEVRDLYAPTVHGVGIIGSKYPTTINGKRTKEYVLWTSMLSRCYSDRHHKNLETYKDCTVSDNFTHYEYFYEWCNNQTGFNSIDFDLDKDLLIKGNKIYSENTCVFLPHEVNACFVKAKTIRGELPIGVTIDKRHNVYVANLKAKHREKSYIASFLNPIDAFNAYKQAKENYLKELANKWKDKIDDRAYKALMNYQVEITD